MTAGRRILAAACAAAWVVLGLYGAISYGHAYYKYRGFEPPKDPHGVAPGRFVHVGFYSEALRKRRSYAVYLPPGYAAAAARGARFPVLYLLHGSPGGPALFLNAADVGVDLDRLVAGGRARPFLIVMPNGSDGTFLSDTEWADTPHGRYESFVLDVVRAVDARWPTFANRRFRALGGDSEGAYASMNIALRHLGEFGIAESWSGYFEQKPLGPFAHAAAATVAANSPAVYAPRLAHELRRLPLHAFIYSGRHERVVPRNRRFAAELRAAGAHVQFAVYPGGHTWELWRQQAPHMLEFADRWFGER